MCSGAGAETEKTPPEVETSLLCPPAGPAHRGLVGEMGARIGLSLTFSLSPTGSSAMVSPCSFSCCQWVGAVPSRQGFGPQLIFALGFKGLFAEGSMMAFQA